MLVGQLWHAAPLDAGCSCGVSQATKIVGGVDAQLHEFPWQASLSSAQNFNKNRPYEVHLSASIRSI